MSLLLHRDVNPQIDPESRRMNNADQQHPLRKKFATEVGDNLPVVVGLESWEEEIFESCGENHRGGYFYCHTCLKHLGTKMGDEPPLPKHENHKVSWMCVAHGMEVV